MISIFRFCIAVFLFLVVIPSSLFATNSIVVQSVGVNADTDGQKHRIEMLLAKPAFDFSLPFLRVILDKNQKEPRGKTQGKTITLSSSIQNQGEFLQLLFHEFGHVVDIYKLTPDITGFDRSFTFYDISWQDVTIKKAGEKSQNFISGYAASNRYEDFAESFGFYIFHNSEFVDRAMRNDSLRQKYLFFQKYVFVHGEFTGTDFGSADVPKYFWDTTKLPIFVNKYLYSLS